MTKLSDLLQNNRAWADGRRRQEPGFFDRLSRQQAPRYLWIGCSDSRVPANEIVGLMPGELFVHRNVANIVVHSDLNCLSVLQYAVDVLHVEHVMVVGHYGCGGVEAAWKRQPLGLIDNWIRHVQDVAERHKERFSKGMTDAQCSDLLCELNVLEQAANVSRTTIVQDAWRRGQPVAVHGWIYGLKDGIVRDLGFAAGREEDIAGELDRALRDSPRRAAERPMSDELWTTVDDYFDEQLQLSDPALTAALAASTAAGLPPIAVTPSQGKLLFLLAQSIGARRTLEIGTLGGYSTIWLARGVGEHGKVVTLEIDAHHADVARSNIANAGLSDRVEVMVGAASDTLGGLASKGEAFDLTFIDADKASSDVYFRLALGLSHPGSLIVVDNVVRDGAVAAESNNANIVGIQQMLRTIAGEPRVSATAIQTVGAKGYDGFVLARVMT